MHQPTRDRITRHLDSLRHDPARLFAGLIDPAIVEDALRQERRRIGVNSFFQSKLTPIAFHLRYHKLN